MKLKIAAYRWVGHPEWQLEVRAVHDPSVADSSDTFYRVSEIVEIDFPPITEEEQVSGALRAVDRQRSEETARHLRELSRIADAEAAHRLLTHEPTETSSDIPF